MEPGAGAYITHAFANANDGTSGCSVRPVDMQLKIGLMSSPLPKNIVDYYLCCDCLV